MSELARGTRRWPARSMLRRPLSAPSASRLPSLAAVAVLASGVLGVSTGQAMAAGVVSSFAVTPASLQAGGNPDITEDLNLSYGDSTDSVKDVTFELAPGLLPVLASAPSTCSPAQLTADTCPADSQVGTGTVTTSSDHAATVYLMPAPSPGDVAGVGEVIESTTVRGTGAFDIQNNPNGEPVGVIRLSVPAVGGQQVNRITATINGTTTNSNPFTRLPTSCSAATSSVAVDTYEASTGSDSASFTPTGCSSLGFTPTLSGFHVIRDPSDSGAELIASISQPSAATESATKALELDIPPSLSANTGPDAACLTGSPCVVGTASGSSPLMPGSALSNGTVTLGGSVVAPTLTVAFPGPVPLSLTGMVNLASDSITFTSQPDLPLSGLTVDITGPAGARAFTTTCAPGSAVARFTPQSGGPSVTSTQPIAYQNCPGAKPPPPAPVPARLRVSIRSRRTLVAHRQARVSLACSGGSSGSACHGRLSLTLRKRVMRRVHGAAG